MMRRKKQLINYKRKLFFKETAIWLQFLIDDSNNSEVYICQTCLPSINQPQALQSGDFLVGISIQVNLARPIHFSKIPLDIFLFVFEVQLSRPMGRTDFNFAND